MLVIVPSGKTTLLPKVPALIVPALAIPPEAVIAPVEVKVPPTETFPVELATVIPVVPSLAFKFVAVFHLKEKK